MSDELRPVWVCRSDGCGLRVRNVDGRPIPEPKFWEDGRCAPCRVEAERIANGPSAANDLHNRIYGIRKRSGPFGHTDPGFEDGAEPKEPKPKRKPRNEPTPEEIERVETELENTCDTDRAISQRVGVPVGRVQQVRDRLGLPSAPERRVQQRRQKIEQFVMADPDRLSWSTEAIAEAIGEEAAKVRGDRSALGLGVGRGHGQPAKSKHSHGGKRERQARLTRVRAFFTEHPNATNAEAAEALNLPHLRIRKDRYDLGLSGRPASEMPKSPA